MATPPVFVSGAILTAAQMNAVGLWLIKTQTIGSAVSSVSITDVFSSDYDNYLIKITGMTASAQADTTMQLAGITTGVYTHVGTAQLLSASAVIPYQAPTQPACLSALCKAAKIHKSTLNYRHRF